MLIFDLLCAKPVHTLAFAPDGRTLASVQGRSQHVALWNLDERRVAATLTGHTSRVVAIAFAPSGEMFASVTFAGSLWVWLCPEPGGLWTATRTLHWARDADRHAAGALAFSPDGVWLASTEHESSYHYSSYPASGVSLTRTDFDKVKRLKSMHTDEVSCLAFSPDGKTLATGSFDRTVRLHPLPKGPSRMLNQAQKVHYLAFSPDGSSLASGSPCGMVRLWDAASGDCRATFHHKPPSLRALGYSPDGRTLATAGGRDAGAVRLWDAATASCTAALDWEIGELHSVAFSADGCRAAAGGVGKIVVWDVDLWDR